MLINLSELKSSHTYFTMIQTILPRPVAWVVSENEDRTYNLAPFSYFNAICSSPPLVSISIGKKKSGDDKDTRRNIAEREFFTIQIPSVEQAQLVTDSAKPFAEGVSEVEELGLELISEEGFKVPRLKNCKVAYFCRREKIIEIGDVPQGLIIGRVESIFIDDSITSIENERLKVDISKFNPLARLGGNDYAGLTAPFTVLPSED